MANNLKIYGIVNRVLKQRSGTTQDGRQWWAQDFVLEVQDGNFVQIVKFTISGKSLTQENVQHRSPACQRGRLRAVLCSERRQRGRTCSDSTTRCTARRGRRTAVLINQRHGIRQ